MTLRELKDALRDLPDDYREAEVLAVINVYNEDSGDAGMVTRVATGAESHACSKTLCTHRHAVPLVRLITDIWSKGLP